ncbi:MAG: T9SS type A sorting domain-containing protein [Ignavibacteria bacterium]|nr:T9SS type A sorting domain-containing protein [Ignavibacteria bacterium]
MKTVMNTIIVLTCIMVNNINGHGEEETTIVSGINRFQDSDVTHCLKTNIYDCDTVYSFDTRPNPSGLTWDGQNLWFVGTSYIYKVSTTGMYLDSIINPASSRDYRNGDLVYDGMNLWYADEESAKLFKINPANGDVLQQVDLPSFGQVDQNGWGLAWDGINIWHSQYEPPRLYKLNGTNGSVVDSLITASGVLGLEWIDGNLYGTNSLYRSRNGTQLYKIDSQTGAFQDSTPWCIPHSLGLTWDGSSLWNISGSESVYGGRTGGKQKIYRVNSGIISSVNEHSTIDRSIEIFPNPTTASISVRGENIETIEIFNVLGEKTYTTSVYNDQTLEEIDLTAFPKGTCFVKIYDGKKTYTKIVVIQ